MTAGTVDLARERLERWGTSPCTDAELLAVVLGGRTATRAPAILDTVGGIDGLLTQVIDGASASQQARVRAAVELGRRSLLPSLKRPTLTGPQAVAAFLIPRYGAAAVESFGVLLLDTKHRVIRDVVVSTGTLDATLAHPREIFAPAIEHRAAGVILWHNHPSGDPRPSAEDRTNTDRLRTAGGIVGIDVLDHLIITSSSYHSFQQAGW